MKNKTPEEMAEEYLYDGEKYVRRVKDAYGCEPKWDVGWVMAAFECGKNSPPNWIKVDEKLPESAGEVMIFSRDNHIQIVWFGENAWLEDDGWEYPIDYATHWMPLPQPPKEEE